MTKKLLLADDSVTIQRVIGIIFATEDYQLLVTDNGDDAYEKAEQELPDLVIADVSMPGKDGFELCQALKSNPRLAETSVMLLPGTFDHFDEERAQAVGADGWLSKPFESQALLDKVEQLLAAEPVRLDAAEESLVDQPAEEMAEPLQEKAPVETLAPVLASAAAAIASSSEAEPEATESSLGQIDAELPEVAAEEAATEDIWDAVSFEEEELEPVAAETDPGSDELILSAAEELRSGEVPIEELDTSEAETDLNIDAESIGFATAEETEPEAAVSSAFDSFASDNDDLLEPGDRQVEESVSAELSEFAEIEDLQPEPVEVAPLLASEKLIAESPADEDLVLDESAQELSDLPQLEEALSEEVALEEADLVAEEEILDLPEQEAALAEVVALDEADLDADEEILDLAEEDILAEEPLPDSAVADGGDELFTADETEDEAFVLTTEADDETDQQMNELEDSFPAVEEEELFSGTALDEAGSEEEIVAPVQVPEPAAEIVAAAEVEKDEEGAFVAATEADDEAGEQLNELEDSFPAVEEEELFSETAVGEAGSEAEIGEPVQELEQVAEIVAVAEVEEDEEDAFVAATEADDEADEQLSELEDSFPAVEEEELSSEADVEAAASEDGFIDSVQELELDPAAEIVAAEVEEDEGFFFDASAAEEDEPEPAVASLAGTASVAVAGVAAGVAATSSRTTESETSLDAPIEQVEQQLRKLSEDELKEVVTKVAGPMIEKLANEMLEQIAWEVVPDLAESMIREEIRRLKQGAE